MIFRAFTVGDREVATVKRLVGKFGAQVVKTAPAVFSDEKRIDISLRASAAPAFAFEAELVGVQISGVRFHYELRLFYWMRTKYPWLR